MSRPLTDLDRIERLYVEDEILALVAEVRRLRAQVAGHCERIAAQSALLSRRAERRES